jgi:hypothetical protein
MFDEEQICPYTGLRSFTEEESLYFKGREEDIDQATEQLQRNKFLMLTGASGDGKSSLIYAGIIPNARAGFLKSKYSQWCVADFRPERTPLDNLSTSIARQLEIDNVNTVKAELNHGFSAIIDLYKNSKKYIDTTSVAWLKGADSEKASQKRQAANLIILIDQFEEFFTNPENYHRGVPSADSNLVLNLLLETARIALEEDLPIYVVFTMRSDYIGQCAAFRGLPEYIGFSQFFVPRLNRTQLQQVIEEPAVLSGNRITRRLTERLIHDLKEGVDQLPILQHALNQIWHAADNGSSEMDLIHYAMVGGMPVNELPDEQVQQFEEWFKGLSPEIKACYSTPNLQNVLDTHTNKLYQQAAAYYKQKTGETIVETDVKAIIKTSFTCLTKIDHSRAVRNRMTLQEISNIFGKPEYGTKEIGAVLNIFREPGNTFIRPFISDDADSLLLHKYDVLDITHESLIRNWRYLEQWAKEEFDNYIISLDFEKQINRWIESGKSNNFLLSIGPLTYFENWFNNTRPNAYWIARYLPEEIEQDKKLANAKQVLSNAREFLKRSANKHFVTRSVMRYGAGKIAAIVALIAVITLSSFAVRDYLRTQNNYVLNSIKTQTFELANNSKLSLEFSVPVITQQLIVDNVTIPEVIEAVKEPKQKINIATGIATQLVLQGRYEPKEQILQSLTIADSLLEKVEIGTAKHKYSEVLKLIHNFSVTAGLAYFFNQDESLAKLNIINANRSAKWALHIYKEQPEEFNDIQQLSLALVNGINHKIFSSDEIQQLINILSPFENISKNIWLQKSYERDKILVRGNLNYGLRFNGLYQDLAYLYAAAGNSEKALQCIDTLLRYQDNFFQNDYATHVENAANIAAVFYTYGTTDSLDDFVKGYSTRKNITTIDFYNSFLSRAVIEYYLSGYPNFYSGGDVYSNLNIKLSSEQMLSFFFDKLKEEVLKIQDLNEKNFSLAVMHKNAGALYGYRKEVRGIVEPDNDQHYKNAFEYFQQVSNQYLNQTVPVVGTSATEVMSVPRKFLFLYPDFRVPYHPFEPRAYLQFYTSYSFIKYVLDNNLFEVLYKTPDDFKYFELWLLDYNSVLSSGNYFLRNPMPFEMMERLALELEERKVGQSADLNILYLHLSEQAFEQHKTDKGISYARKILPNKLLNAFQYKTIGFLNSYSFELVGKAIANLIVNNQFDVAYDLLNVFKKEVNRSSLYGYASQLISLKEQPAKTAIRLIDSARIEMNRLENPAVFQPNRHQLAMALMYHDPKNNSEEAYRTIKNSNNKFAAMYRFGTAHAFHGNLYSATEQVPALISAGDKAAFLFTTIEGLYVKQVKKKEWINFKKNEFIHYRRFLPYINESQ